MTIIQGKAQELSSALLKRMTWATYAVSTSKRLMRGVQRRSRLPRVVRLHLRCLENIRQTGASSVFSRLDLVWYQPAWRARMTTPIEIYLSRHYHLFGHSTRHQRTVAAGQLRAPILQLSLPPHAEPNGSMPTRRMSSRDLHYGGLVTRSPLATSRSSVGSRDDLHVQSSLPSMTGMPFVSLMPALLNKRRGHDQVPTMSQAGQLGKPDTSIPPPLTLPLRDQRQSEQGSVPQPITSANLVDALFDQAMERRAMPDLTLHMLPQSVTPKSGQTGTDIVRTINDLQRPSTPQATPHSVPLGRSDVTMIADQVVRVLKQQARLERERRGHY